MKVLVLNGPNLGRLGRRQPEIYGTTTHAELAHRCVEWGAALGLEVEVRQTNHEGDLLDWLNAAADDGDAVVLNAGAWTHYSLALWDACAQLSAPLVEVHLSDPKQRPEEFRHTSVVEPHAVATIAGEGVAAVCAALGWPSYADPAVALAGCTAPGAVVQVAVVHDGDGDRVVGFAQVFGDGVVQGFLSQLGVLAEHRRRGLGRRLVEAAHTASGCRRLDLVTDDADDFYRSFPHRAKPGYRIYPGAT